MKKAKRMAAVVLCLCVVALCMGFTQQRDAGELAAERAMSRQEEALDAYQLLWDSFEKEPESLQPYYPDEYGGEYIDDDKLVIQLTENTPENQAKYRELCGNSDKVVFEKVTYSLNYLNSLESVAEEMLEDYAVTSYGVDRKENQFAISVEASDLEEAQLSFYRRRSSEPIVFREGAPMQTLSSILPGGRKITSETSNGCSITVMGTYNGKDALVSCGHDLYAGNNISYNGIKVAKIKVSNYKDRGYGDYSISEVTNSSYSGSSYVLAETGQRYVTSIASAPQGTAISKNGMATGYTTGYVSMTNTAIRDKKTDYILNGMSTCSFVKAAKHGDSGGPIFIPTSGGVKLVGGLSCQNTSDDESYIYYGFSTMGYVTNLGFRLK